MDMAAGQALAGIVAVIGLIVDVDCRRHNRLGTTPLLQLVALSQLLQTKDRRPCDEAPDRRQATHRQCWRGHVQLAAGVVHLSSLSSFSCWKTSNAFRHNGLCTARLLQLVALAQPRCGARMLSGRSRSQEHIAHHLAACAKKGACVGKNSSDSDDNKKTAPNLRSSYKANKTSVECSIADG